MAVAKYNGKCFRCSELIVKGTKIDFKKVGEGFKPVHIGCDQSYPVHEGMNAIPMFEMFIYARQQGVKYPKAKFHCDGCEIEFRLAGTGSKHYRSLLVRGPKGQQGYSGEIGHITMRGEFHTHVELNDDIVQVIRTCLDNPVEATRKFGELMGHCGFCGKGLTTMESIGAGYGPVCADHFGLPWGAKKFKFGKPDMLEVEG